MDENDEEDNDLDFSMPSFKKWDVSKFYDYKNEILHYEDFQKLEESVKAARLANFKITKALISYSTKEEEAKVKYKRAWSRAYLNSNEKTDSAKKARADLACERLENDVLVNSRVRADLAKLSDTLKMELQMLQSIGNNLRQQLKME